MKKIITDNYGDSILVLTSKGLLSNIVDEDGFLYSPTLESNDCMNIFDIDFGNIRVYYKSLKNKNGLPERVKNFSRGIFSLSDSTEDYISRYHHMTGEKISFNR